MTIRIKLRCPLCNLTHFCGDINDPTKLENVEPVDPEISFVTVTSGGRGKIRNHVNLVENMKGEHSRADEIEREILKVMLTKAETLVMWLELRLQEV